MKARKLLLLCFILPALPVVLCAQVQTSPSNPLNGNWRISQEPGPGVTPAFSLGVEGNTIYGEGGVSVSCRGDSVGDNVFVRGQIADDGSFSLTNSSYPARRVTVSIQGKVPDKDLKEWSGTYTFAAVPPNPANGDCPPVSRSFVATRFPLLKGIYSGTLQASFQGEKVTDVVLELEQGPEITPMMNPRPGKTTSAPVTNPPFDHIIPLRAKITFSNSLHIPAQTWTTADPPAANSRMQGSTFDLHFTKDNDGNSLHVSGSFDPTRSDESHLQVDVIYMPHVEEGKTPFTHAAGRLSLIER
jgi:hypothetical protein